MKTLRILALMHADLVPPEDVTGIDTTAAAGPGARFSAQIQAAAAELERGLISVRTREGMAQRKAEGAVFGRRRAVPADVIDRIIRERAAGQSFGKIAAGLNADKVPTAQGGKAWYPATVSKVLDSAN